MLHINRPRPPTLPRCPCERENTIWLFYHAANNLPIYISVRSARPPPPPLLRCLIGSRRPEVQPGRPSADRSERAMHCCVWKWTVSHRVIPADLKKTKNSLFSCKAHCSNFWARLYKHNGLWWWRLLGMADKLQRAFIIIYPFGGSYFSIWKTPLFSRRELLKRKMGIWW